MQLCEPLTIVNVDTLLDPLATMLRADLDGITSRLRDNPDTQFHIDTPYGRHSITYAVDQWDASEHLTVGFVLTGSHV